MSEPQSLADVVTTAMIEQQVNSGAALERLAKAAGHTKITATTINHLKAGTYQYRPNRETIEALSYLSKIPVRIIARLVNREPVTGTPLHRRLPQDVDILTATEQDAILRLLRMMIETRKVLNRLRGDEDTESGPQ